MGVESGAQSVLDAMEKGTTVAEVREATRLLKAKGVRAAWFLQLGYPGEAWAEILTTRDLIRDERPDDVGVSVAYPLPGTAFFERVKSQLGARTHWKDSDDLAMMFEGTYKGPFYRRIRDLLHEEALLGSAAPSLDLEARSLRLDGAWAKAQDEEAGYRTDSGADSPGIAI